MVEIVVVVVVFSYSRLSYDLDKNSKMEFIQTKSHQSWHTFLIVSQLYYIFKKKQI